jgi:serine/threonine-protein kinase PknG
MFLASVTAADPDELLSLLQAAPDRSVEIDLRMARTLIDCGRPDQAAVHLDAVEARDPWDWRVTWYRGIASLAAGETHDAEACFTSVYHAVPGELAPKLALAYVAEHRGDSSDAARWYDIVSRTDTAFPSAAFGLARCLAKAGDRRGAVAALDRVPAASSAHVEAQLAKVKVMVATTDGAAPDLADVAAASAVIERLALDDARHASLAVAVFEASVSLLLTAGPPPDSTVTVLGRPFTERDMRLGLEATYRTLARHAATPRQRVTLVERANQVRPRTLV